MPFGVTRPKVHPQGTSGPKESKPKHLSRSIYVRSQSPKHIIYYLKMHNLYLLRWFSPRVTATPPRKQGRGAQGLGSVTPARTPRGAWAGSPLSLCFSSLDLSKPKEESRRIAKITSFSNILGFFYHLIVLLSSYNRTSSRKPPPESRLLGLARHITPAGQLYGTARRPHTAVLGSVATALAHQVRPCQLRTRLG